MQKTIENSEIKGRRYGLLSMLSMIVGVVIGSGIFVKNQQIASMNASPFESIIGWIIISVIVLFILISFIEISSLSMKKKEAGTLSNWSRHLWGEGLSKFIGFFFPIVYFPILLAGLSVFSSDYVLTAISNTTGPLNLFDMGIEWSEFLLISLIGMGTIGIIGAMNAFTNKPGKIFQATGTVVKLIPLFAVVFVGFMVMAGGIDGDLAFNDIFNPNSEVNQEIINGRSESMLMMIIMILPAVMFSFDGFLFAASLSNEAKTPRTFRSGAIIGVTFIILIYLSVTLFTYLTSGVEGTVEDVITKLFDGAEWAAPLVLYIIFVSMVTGISGNIISSNRMMADVSAQKLIVDKNGILTKRTTNGSLYRSGIMMISLAFSWFVILRAFDGLDLFNQMNQAGNSLFFVFENSFSVNRVTGWATDLITISSFSIYTILMLGGLKNRYTKKIEVEKNKAFIPSTFIASIVTITAVGYFAYDVLSFSGGFTDGYFYYTIGKIVILSMAILTVLIVNHVSNRKKEKTMFTNQEVWWKKIYDFAYNNILTVDEAVEIHGNTIPAMNEQRRSFEEMKEELSTPEKFFIINQIPIKEKTKPTVKKTTTKPVAKKPTTKPVAKKTTTTKTTKPVAKKTTPKTTTKKPTTKPVAKKTTTTKTTTKKPTTKPAAKKPNK